MPGQQGGWNLPQANSNFSGGRAANPILNLFAGRRAEIEKLNNAEIQSKAQIWTADQKAGNEVKHAKLHANHMANAQVGDELDEQGNVTKKATNPDGTPVANVNHGKPLANVLSGVRVGQTSTTFQKLGNTAKESTANKKRTSKSGGGNRGGGKGRGGTIAATIAAVKAGHVDFEQATGGEFGDEHGISPKMTADFGAHVAAGGNQESYLNQFGDSGRRRRTKNTPPPGNNGGNS
jgi:hypothetical protein